jgi:hypothetical protein
MTTPRFYVAASSRETDRAARVMRVLEAAGYRNSHDWIPGVLEAFASGITEAKADDAHAESAALADLEGVAACDVLIFLAPTDTSKMAWHELGFAMGQGKPCIVAHDSLERRNQSIVTRLCVRTTDAGILNTVRQIVDTRPKWIKRLEYVRWLIGKTITHETERRRVTDAYRIKSLTEQIEGDLDFMGHAYISAMSCAVERRDVA